MEAVPIVLLKGNRTIVMNAEGSESLPLHSNKLACPSFMAAGRRHEIPGPETKDFIIRGTAGSMSLTVKSVSFNPQVPWEECGARPR